MAMIFMASGNFQNILKANLKSKNLFKLFPKNSDPLQFLLCSGSQKVPFGSIPYKAVLLYQKHIFRQTGLYIFLLKIIQKESIFKQNNLLCFSVTQNFRMSFTKSGFFRKWTQSILITLKKNCNNIHNNASKLTLYCSSTSCHSIHLRCLIIYFPLCLCIFPRFPFLTGKELYMAFTETECMITEICFALLASRYVQEVIYEYFEI